MSKFLTLSELSSGLTDILHSPRDVGVLKAIVTRPETDKRVSHETCEISPEFGVHGDRWSLEGGPAPDSHLDMQVAIMNARTIALIAQLPERWQLAGDNLFVDMDLSEDNLPCGQRIAVGSAVLQITPVAHNGCKKFASRFGADAVKFVNSAEGKKLHLRGLYAKVIQSGVIHAGDEFTKIPAI